MWLETLMLEQMGEQEGQSRGALNLEMWRYTDYCVSCFANLEFQIKFNLCITQLVHEFELNEIGKNQYLLSGNFTYTYDQILKVFL